MIRRFFVTLLVWCMAVVIAHIIGQQIGFTLLAPVAPWAMGLAMLIAICSTAYSWCRWVLNGRIF